MTTPFFLTNKKWYTLENRTTADGTPFQRFELTNKATPEAIASLKATMIAIGPEGQIEPENLNRFQQALGYAARRHYLSEAHGLSDNDLTHTLNFISYAIRSYQLLDDTLTPPNTLIFSKRIATLYRQFLKQHPARITDPELNAWIVAQDQRLPQ